MLPSVQTVDGLNRRGEPVPGVADAGRHVRRAELGDSIEASGDDDLSGAGEISEAVAGDVADAPFRPTPRVDEVG